MTDGIVEFFSQDGTNTRAIGNISSEGMYSLKTTFLNGSTIDGAVEGEHRVTAFGPAVGGGGSPEYRLGKIVCVKPFENTIDLQVSEQAR